MNLKESMNILDSAIPHPQSRMVDMTHLPIAQAWQKAKTVLLDYESIKDKHDTMMKRYAEQLEVIRHRIDTGNLNDDEKRLLDDLNLPRNYDKREKEEQNAKS